MKNKALAAVLSTLLILLLTGCGEVEGTVIFKNFFPAHTDVHSGNRPHTTQVPYTASCTTTTTSGGQTRTSSYPCTKYRSHTYYVWETWTTYVPDCWQLVIEVTKDDGSKRSIARCVSNPVWTSKNVGDHYNSEEDR